MSNQSGGVERSGNKGPHHRPVGAGAGGDAAGHHHRVQVLGEKLRCQPGQGRAKQNEAYRRHQRLHVGRQGGGQRALHRPTGPRVAPPGGCAQK
eukprot:3729390-Lingulodinium_polyedra.AAC.1